MTISIYHVAGYSQVDHFGPEIVNRVRLNTGSVSFQTIKDARAAVRQAMSEMPESMNRMGPPRIDAVRDDGKEWERL